MTITAPGPCLDCRRGCPVIGGPCSTGSLDLDAELDAPAAVDAFEREMAALLAQPLDPADRSTGCFPGPRVVSPCPTRASLFGDPDEPDALYPGRLSAPRLSVGERLVTLALVGPWLAAATGAIVVAAAAEALRSVRRG